jgi:hypothetical protein
MGVNLDKETQFKLNSSTTDCSWVPAVFCSKKKNGLKIYGGVSLQIDLKEGIVQRRNPQAQEINADTLIRNASQQQEMVTTSNRNGEMSHGSGNRGGSGSGGGSGHRDPPDDDSHERKPLGRKSTGRTEPRNLLEQIAMQAAIAGAAGGTVLEKMILGDRTWPVEDGWVKMRYSHTCYNASKIVIHYLRNTMTGEIDDFKYKDHQREK